MKRYLMTKFFLVVILGLWGKHSVYIFEETEVLRRIREEVVIFRPGELRIDSIAQQGAVTASRILAEAFLLENRWVREFPIFGGGQSGEPVKVFLRVDNNKGGLTRNSSEIYKPDWFMAFANIKDINLVFENLKPNGIALINSDAGITIPLPRSTQKFFVVSARKIAEELGDEIMMNMVMLGAFVKATRLLKFSSLIEAIRKYGFSPEVVELNIEAARRGYNEVKEYQPSP
ncbi:MAG: 2-oxoacid:acceptor oxidoreductase family protein [Candidatus Omnitrophica bacterium]|nr:2-oxoacid:acceptor oxidoreductase family protein [Candidatus Omnitrophota bacterium]